MEKITILINLIFLFSCSNLDQVTIKENETNSQIGIYIKEVSGGVLYSHRENERFPFMSTIKTVIAGSVLSSTDLSEKIKIPNEKDLVSWSPFTKKYIGKNKSVRTLINGMLSFSDNTATNLLIEKLGGVNEINQFLASLGDNVTRLDRVEPELNDYNANDLKDTTTPRAICEIYEKLLFGSFLKKESREYLLSMLRNNKVSNSLLRSFIPRNYQVADRSGAGSLGSRGIVGVIFPQNKRPLIISIFLKESELNIKDRDRTINSIIRNILHKNGYLK